MASSGSVRLQTFLSWGVSEIIGRVTETQTDQSEKVVKIWCKVCAKHAHKVRCSLRGKALHDFERYVQGTEFITKHTVMRHISDSSAHKTAAELEKLSLDTSTSRPASESGAVPATSTRVASKQPNIFTSMQGQAREGYRLVNIDNHIGIKA